MYLQNGTTSNVAQARRKCVEFASNGKHGEIQKVQFDESPFIGAEEIAIVKIKMQCICAAFFVLLFVNIQKP